MEHDNLACHPGPRRHLGRYARRRGIASRSLDVSHAERDDAYSSQRDDGVNNRLAQLPHLSYKCGFMKTLTIRLPDGLARRIEQESLDRRVSKSDVVRERLD